MLPTSTPLEGGRPGETFRRWSLDLLAVLCPGEADPAPEVRCAIERLLVERFEQGLRGLAAQLRDELPAWQEAARHLERLAGSQFSPAPEAVHLLRGQLEARTHEAASLLAALEAVPHRQVGRPLPPPPPTPFSADEPAQQSAAGPVPLPALPAPAPPPPAAAEAESAPAEGPVPAPDPATEPAPTPVVEGARGEEGAAPVPGARSAAAPPSPARPVDPRALAHCRRGDACRQRGENERALQEYSAAIQIDPRDKAAYLRRGRLYRLTGDLGRAIEDFNAAARIDPTDPEPFCQRAQARGANGELDRAVEDFDQALRLKPDCTTTRFRRAIVWRLQGKLEPAVAEFTELIRLRPDQAVLYYQRGLARLDGGEPGRAVADFTEAVRLNPHYQEAHQKRQEACAARRPAPTPAAGSRKQDTAGDTLPVASTAGSARTEPHPENCLQVVCPECGAVGNVPWDRLGRILTCRGCSRMFRVDAGGRLVEVVKTPEGRWIHRSAREANSARAMRKRWALWLVPTAAMLTCLVLGLWAWRHRSAVSPLPELPRGLEERAELLARAWQKKDVPLMRRMTGTTHDRILYSWFVRHQPPATAAGLEEAEPPTVKVVRRQDQTAQVVVRMPRNGGKQSPVELQLHWEQRGDTWYFVPPPR
jgi:tetratricopeptide (TPR) repeat protein